MPTLTLRPDDPHIAYSDYIRLTLSPERARFDRLIDAEHGMGHDSPGTRIRFQTDGAVAARFHYTALHTHDKQNGVGVVLVDGGKRFAFDASQRPGLLSVPLGALGGTMHDFELLLPYADSVDFLGLEVTDDAEFAPVGPRPAFRYVAYGDSITQGYWASDVTGTFACLLAKAKNWTLINMGYGGRQATAGDGALVGSVPADLITCSMGANDAIANKSAAQFRADMEGVVSGIRSRQPMTPLYLITPLFSTQPFGGAPLEQFRTELRDLVSHAADANLHLIEGPELTPHDEGNLPDGIHPNDAAFAIMAQRLTTMLPARIL